VTVTRDVQRGSPAGASPDRDDRFLEPERGEHADGVEAVGERDGRSLEFGGEVTREHRVDRVVFSQGWPCERSESALARLIGEREHVSPPNAERSGDRSVPRLACGRSRPVSRFDVDGNDAAASLRERPRDRRPVADADLDEAVVSREFVDQRAAGG